MHRSGTGLKKPVPLNGWSRTPLQSLRPLDQRPSSAPSHLGQLSPRGAWRASLACLVLACAQAVSLVRSLSLAAYTQSQGARQAPSRCALGPAAGDLREWCLVASRACRAVATGTVLCHGAALCAQRSALSAMINLNAPPMRKRGVARDRCQCSRAFVVQGRCSRGSGQGYGVWLAQGFNAGLWCTCSFGDRNREDQKLP